MIHDIALMGYARSGKDTVAKILVEEYGYVRVAFADPLRAVALKLDPYIGFESYGDGETETWRLSEAVDEYGWEGAKADFPEVRRTLQHIGQGIRDLEEFFWINVADQAIRKAHRQGKPVVITDVRYPNEYNRLGAEGFTMVRVTRPDTGPANGHVSESALDGFTASVTLDNNGTLADLRWGVSCLLFPQRYVMNIERI